MRLHDIVKSCSREHGFVYVICAVIPLLFGYWASEYGAAAPYAVVLFLLALQFFRPTILGWLLLLVVFGACTVWLFGTASSFEEFSLGVLVGLGPTVMLAWARPKLLSSA